MLKQLISLANDLDQRGLRKEANYLDALLRKAATREEWAQHEDHPLSLEQPGGESAELEEDFEKGLSSAREVAEMIVGGSPIVGEDADTSVGELADLLNTDEHLPAVEAVLNYFGSMKGSNEEGLIQEVFE